MLSLSLSCVGFLAVCVCVVMVCGCASACLGHDGGALDGVVVGLGGLLVRARLDSVQAVRGLDHDLEDCTHT